MNHFKKETLVQVDTRENDFGSPSNNIGDDLEFDDESVTVDLLKMAIQTKYI